ncbi:hypothetical protein FA95DRAFT_1276667 [Auriscalpium vulgare]|uniref:Uncharacterized protein n=1 Tax=Auriscalpium vulgare TaxID=40419 RepID=A0ACB8RSJ6_9AGAM|nr:hypothetical protein FA95DRAFT_1276667 [Auriscalpium vulgare]
MRLEPPGPRTPTAPVRHPPPARAAGPPSTPCAAHPASLTTTDRTSGRGRGASRTASRMRSTDRRVPGSPCCGCAVWSSQEVNMQSWGFEMGEGAVGDGWAARACSIVISGRVRDGVHYRARPTSAPDRCWRAAAALVYIRIMLPSSYRPPEQWPPNISLPDAVQATVSCPSGAPASGVLQRKPRRQITCTSSIDHSIDVRRRPPPAVRYVRPCAQTARPLARARLAASVHTRDPISVARFSPTDTLLRAGVMHLQLYGHARDLLTLLTAPNSLCV